MKSFGFKVMWASAFAACLLMTGAGTASAGGGLQQPTVEPAKAAPGEKVTVAGKSCMGEDAQVIVKVADWAPVTVSDVKGGSWSAVITVPGDAEPGVKPVAATCDRYNSDDEYPKASLEVVAAPATEAGVRTDVSSVAVGGKVAVTASGFEPGEEISVTLFSDPVKLGALTADGDGGASDTFTIPVSVAVGVHRLELKGLTSERVASTEITVTEASDTPTDGTDGTGSPTPGPQDSTGAAPSGNLAFTGSNVFRVTLVALVAMVAGAGLLVLRRRRIA